MGEGEIVGLLGLNGAGKTTTIRILTGYLIASDGICEIDGINTFENPLEVKKKIGYLPETPPLYPELSVQDYLKFAARIKQVSSELIDSEIDRVCERTFLTDVRKNDIETLSLGFRKRVGIAQALLGNPRIVILDEPVSGLDPKQIVEIRNLIHSLKDGHTILLSSHILPEVYKTCNRFLFLHQGRMVYQRDRKQLEEEMEKVSGLEVTLSETDVASGKKYLSSFPGVNVDKIRSIGEDSRGNTFLVSTSTEREFKEKLFASASSSPRLEYIRKQEVTLEQIFMNQV
ncbi:ABC transporter, ATP-binding protein [Leptospira interrogans str. UI 13372]|uniref:ABC transporter, ATP-binding protein n=1 Tax=Leptospira interrogans serovar Copenhageni str. LT2050 TaxID=1001598 RepID=M3IND9_LEPIT|nr:ABC transporter, ATP-binding protein [Leptospira interrogans serovar Copenhageni str. LT2050]EMN71888.1 ABC transporter, ATP-binding protein [Leptospira interrogans serovar Bataviae str. UI 08561]EMO94937.1 ABC transporter, ATP-binding protein [Leptospira interrogans str. UI 13372]